MNNAFCNNIKISILTVLCDTSKPRLKDTLKSVSRQTYANWELCVADISKSGDMRIGNICEKLSKKHKDKVIYRQLDNNTGILEGTNECAGFASGSYIALLGQNDVLHPDALFETVRAINEQGADLIYSDECEFEKSYKDSHNPFFKPDFSPDTLRSNNYIRRLIVFRKSLLRGNEALFNCEYDGAQEYDLVLRLSENADNIVHIPKVLYFRRNIPNSATGTNGINATNPGEITAAVNALNEHLKRVNLKGVAYHTDTPGCYRIEYELTGSPLVSIIIPSSDNVVLLRKCIESILEKTAYNNYEIIIADNNSKEPETSCYYKSVVENKRVKVLMYDGDFNFSKICNYAISKSSGEYILLLNNDTEVISDSWLEQMLMYAQRSDVGAVGTMLYYPDDTIQHAGVILGMNGVADHIHRGCKRGDSGYFQRLLTVQNLSCITAACMMIPREVYAAVGGMNEQLHISYNDIDLCMRIRKAGYLIVWTPYAQLYHHEKKSRGEEDTPEKLERATNEAILFQKIWTKELQIGDPYYNINLPLDTTSPFDNSDLTLYIK